MQNLVEDEGVQGKMQEWLRGGCDIHGGFGWEGKLPL